MPRKKKKEYRVQLIDLNVDVPRLLVHGSLQQLGDRSIFDTTYTVELKRDVMSSIIPTLLVGQKNKSLVHYKSLDSTAILSYKQVAQCRKFFNRNYKMFAHCLVILHRIETSRRTYIESGVMEKSQAVQQKLSIHPFFKDEQEAEHLRTYLKRLIACNKRMNQNPHLVASHRSLWKYWSTWGEMDEKEVLKKNEINERKRTRVSILETHEPENVYKKVFPSSRRTKRSDNRCTNIITKERSKKADIFNSTSRLITMLVTQATKDEAAQISTDIWNSLQVSDPMSYMNCNANMIPEALKLEIIKKKKKKKTKNLEEQDCDFSDQNEFRLNLKSTNPMHSSFRDYYDFFHEVNRFSGGMEVTHTLSTFMAIIAMSFLWDNANPSSEDQYMALWQVGWKKYAVASNNAIGMDSHLNTVLKLWKMYDDKKWKEQQIMSYLSNEIYMELNDTVAGICQLCKNVHTKVQATCFLHLLGNEKKEFKQYVKCWMNKYLGTEWERLLKTDEAKTLSKIMIRDVFIEHSHD